MKSSVKIVPELLDRAPLSKFHYVILVVASLVYMLAALNVMLIAAVMVPISRDWELDPLTVGLLFSSGYAGMFLGALSFGIIADRMGRKTTLALVIVLMSLFTAACGLAWDVPSMMLFRFLAGIGLGAVLPQPGIYVSEYVPAEYRGRFLGLVETSWVYGALLSLLFPLVLLPSFGWRVTFSVALIPLALIPAVWALLPESIRYLERRGMKRRIVEIFRERLGLEVSEEELAIGGERGGRLSEILSRRYLRRTFLLWILWAVLVYTYHGIFLWLPKMYYDVFGLTEVRSIWWTLVVTLFQVPGYYTATFLLDRLGRKPVLTLFLAIAGLGSALLGFRVEMGWIIIWSIVISFFNLGAWAGLYTYTPELYPTELRGTGSGAAASVGRLAGILAPTLTSYLYMTGGLTGAYTGFFLAHIVAALATVTLGVETKGLSLEEISLEREEKASIKREVA